MTDDDDPSFEDLLDSYLEPPVDPNESLAGIEIVWVEGDPRLGAEHMWREHHVSKREVEQVLFEIPPMVEARRSRESPERTIFWGATRRDRWLVIVCEDWTEGGRRYLKPITAFEPDDGEDYWRRQ